MQRKIYKLTLPLILLLLISCSSIVGSTSNNESTESYISSTTSNPISSEEMESSLEEKVSSQITDESSISEESSSIQPLDYGTILYYPYGESGFNSTYKRQTETKDISSIDILDFGSFTDGKLIYFNWSGTDGVIYDYIKITINSPSYLEKQYYVYETDHFSVEIHKKNLLVDFNFEPYYKGKKGNTFTFNRYISPDSFHTGLPTVNIVTGRVKNASSKRQYTWPTCRYVYSPTTWGGSITDNDYVTKCGFQLIDKSGNLLTSQEDVKIKLRGNSSAYQDKKPYKLKLDKKVDLLKDLLDNRDDGINHKEKEWILLAKGEQILDYTGFLTSKYVGQDYAPIGTYINLFINGEYQGAYMLTESITNGEGRVNVSNNGFVFENDGIYWNESLYLKTRLNEFSDNHVAFTFKYPDTDELTLNSEPIQYIKAYIERFESAFYDKKTLEYQNYVDEESFARWLLVHDLIGTWDSGGSNMYLSKYDSTDESKIKAGPCWDFDSVSRTGSNEMYRLRWEDHYYIKQFLTKPSFVSIHKKLFDELKSGFIKYIEDNLYSLDFEAMNKSLEYNSYRWKGFCDYQSIEDQVSFLLTYFTNRLNFLKTQI